MTTSTETKPQFCRTCGFYHEPGDCPRWPARDTALCGTEWANGDGFPCSCKLEAGHAGLHQDGQSYKTPSPATRLIVTAAGTLAPAAELTDVERIQLARIRSNHELFTHAMDTDGRIDPAWAGSFGVNLGELLRMIDRMTGQNHA